MAVNLIITTLIPVVIFIPFVYLKKDEIFEKQSTINLFFVGGASWAVIAFVTALPSFLLYDSYTADNYAFAIQERKALLFWLIVVFAFIFEFVRMRVTIQLKYFEHNYKKIISFALGWTLSQISSHYLFFFDNKFSGLYLLIFYILIFLINYGLVILMTRCEENTKFYIFSVFMQLIINLGIYGAIGFNSGDLESLLIVSGIVFLELLMVGQSILARKYKAGD